MTLLKFLVAAVIFLAAGPFAMKFLFGNKRTDEYVDAGLPMAPKEGGLHVKEVCL